MVMHPNTNRMGHPLMTKPSPNHPPGERIPNPRPDRHLSTTDLAGVVEALTGQRLLPRPGAETDPRVQ
ncbi:hypothetical protein [Rhodococcus wratislaviensis]|uniref:hypothetical protein n=1 Tax=Rhodococcus wratislaviensis TaxID=44752 RepID=UPI0036460B50